MQTLARPGAALAALMISLAAASSADARKRVLAPPGNSAIGQYLEVIPTASGGRPVTTVHPGGGSSGSGGGGGGSPGTGARSPFPAATAKALAARGAEGAAVANLTRATAPSVERANGSRQPLGGGAGASPASSLLKAVTGSSPSGGLGIILPVLLAASLLGAGLLAWRRRQRAS